MARSDIVPVTAWQQPCRIPSNDARKLEKDKAMRMSWTDEHERMFMHQLKNYFTTQQLVKYDPASNMLLKYDIDVDTIKIVEIDNDYNNGELPVIYIRCMFNNVIYQLFDVYTTTTSVEWCY